MSMPVSGPPFSPHVLLHLLPALPASDLPHPASTLSE